MNYTHKEALFFLVLAVIVIVLLFGPHGEGDE
jgi:hypothetical protein